MTDKQPNGVRRGWTIDTYASHNEALREADIRFQDERDRRYREVGIEREKALRIKETADLAALGLAREIQTYKDEKANQLREQINSERGLYVTQAELKPIADFVTAQLGRSGAQVDMRTLIFALVAAGGTIIGIVALLLTLNPGP